MSSVSVPVNPNESRFTCFRLKGILYLSMSLENYSTASYPTNIVLVLALIISRINNLLVCDFQVRRMQCFSHFLNWIKFFFYELTFCNLFYFKTWHKINLFLIKKNNFLTKIKAIFFLVTYRSSHPEVFREKGVFKGFFCKTHGKTSHLFWGLFQIKL